MSKKNKKDKVGESLCENQQETLKNQDSEATVTVENQNGEQAENADSTAPVSEVADIEAVKAKLAASEIKASEHWSLFLSAKAEADNVRKRAERDVSNAHKYALDKFIPELLAVKDALELGGKAAKESANKEKNEQMEKFIEGNTMAIDKFAGVLKKFGVKPLEPKDERFNPELHQAVTMVPDAERPDNTVIEVIQIGYLLNDRLLRPAMVVVSKAT